MNWSLIVHGGAIFQPVADAHSLNTINQAAELGAACLRQGWSPVDTVTATIRFLEDSGVFNAGSGGSPTSEGRVELEASIMRGSDLAYGSIIRTSHPNPIATAQWLLKGGRQPFYMLVDSSASVRPSQGITKDTHLGTVGCCVWVNGELAAGTSTGGIAGRPPGRVGGIPIIGSGTYADDEVAAISTSGIGEELTRYQVAYDVVARMKYTSCSLQEAMESITAAMPPATVAMIGINAAGQPAVAYNTPNFVYAIRAAETVRGLTP